MTEETILDDSELFNPEAALRRIAEIDVGLGRARARQLAYEAKGDLRSAWIEETVQDRLLRERLVLVS